MTNDEDYIYVREAAAILKVGERQVHYWGNDPSKNLRTQKSGKHVLYHRGDVQRLANERNSQAKPIPRQRASVMTPGQYLEQIQRLEDLLGRAREEIGYLRGLLKNQLLPDEAHSLRQQLYETQQREQQREAEIERLRLQHQQEIQELKHQIEIERLQNQLEQARREASRNSEEG